ncbi:MAG: asparagine synthase-related protein [Cyanobacteriota bacterium]|nr:asparagine synthase-related protein [Cyanobacteriota bacterium]
MSGICGIFNLDGQAIDRSLLETMTAFLDFRGPDARGMWSDRAVGFGHTLLQTTEESAAEQQPHTLEGEVYITADVRIDGRDDLISQLRTQGRSVRAEEPDANLILHAYRVWGRNCLESLIGDFAFALWDARENTLWCVRDPCGIKLLYWTQVGQTFIFSNTLNCLRLHPQLSSRLNEETLRDFLLFNINCESDTTAFAEIHCLPGGHQITIAGDKLRSRSYWTLPLPQQIRYRRDRDYIEHFQALMDIAVRDRLRTPNVSIFLSGGLDSTTIAATALDVAQKRNQPLDLHAFTVVYNRLIPDREGEYAAIAAEALHLPLHYLVADDYQLYQGWDGELQFSEPLNSPLVLATRDQLQQVATHSRVVLYGQGGDEAFRIATVREMLQVMPPGFVFLDVLRCLFGHHLKPPLGTGLLGTLRAAFGPKRPPRRSPLPTWLNPDFARRLNCDERWHHINGHPLPLDRPPRSLSYHGLPPTPAWHAILAFYDAGCFGVPVEVRLPFLDLRLLDYLLALPPLPWCVGKELLRVALRGKLPERICQRPKSPITVDPVGVLANARPRSWYDRAIGSQLESYVDLPAWKAAISGEMTSQQAWSNLRPLSLNYWLQQLD